MPRTPSDPHDASATAYPPRRVFVIKLHADAHPGFGPCSGRLEHVLTGRQRLFANLAELLAALDTFDTDIDSQPSTRKTP